MNDRIRLGDPRLPERFWSKVVSEPSGCWTWRGKRRDGYGRFWLEGRAASAHCVAYTVLVGDIPDGLFIDHTCHSGDQSCPGGAACLHRACCNPDHLKPVTKRENTLLGRGPSARHAQKTCCPQQHPYDDENTHWHQGRRYCRACQRERDAQRH